MYAVKEAYKRSGAFERLDPGHQAIAILHFAGLAAIEYAAVTLEARFARFAPTPRWRNIAIFLHQLAELSRRAGDELDALVLDSLWQDAERSRRWTTALVRFALAQGDNRAAFERHLARWRPRASKLLRDGAELLAAHGGGDPGAIAEAREAALRELHARTGLEGGRSSGEHR